MKQLILIAILITSQFIAFTQTWRSAYYPANWTPPTTKNFYTDAFLQDFSYAGYYRGEKEISIPSSLQVYDVTKAPYNADKTGAKDATAAIQSAIDAAQTAGGGVVYMPAGTYQLNPGSNTYCLHITKSNIYLKGAGVGKTFLYNNTYTMKGKKIISIAGSASWTTIPTSKALLTSDIMKPVNVLPIDNPSLFKVGDLVIVRNTVGDEWITEHKETDWLTYGSNLRGLMYCRFITAVDVTNKTITIDVPVRYALKTRDAACVFKITGTITDVGISDFSIGNIQHPSTTGWTENDYNVAGTGGYDCDGSYLVVFNSVANCFMKKVETYKLAGNTTGTYYLSNGVLVQYSKGVTIDSCNISHAQYGGANGNGYAYRISANEVLVSNSTAYYIRHGFVFSSMWCSGNVIHNCIDKKTGIQCGSSGGDATRGWGSDHHMHFSQSNLIDQCYSENSAFIAYYRPYGTAPLHDLTSAHTAFWNTSSGGTKGYCVWTQQARYGYAIGTSGTSATVFTKENLAGSAAKTDPVDIVEGQGLGATLVPQSLYLDQLDKRLHPIVSSIDSLSLIDGSTGTVIAGFSNLTSIKTIDKNTINATLFNIYANTSNSIDSVIFTYDLNGDIGSRKEKTAPYSLRGDGTGYTNWSMLAGIYSITAKAFYEGIIISTKIISFLVIETTTQILQFKKSGFSIYPNPANLEVTIDFVELAFQNPDYRGINTSDRSKIIITNTIGQVVFSTDYIPLISDFFSINVSMLKPGIYLLHFENSTKMFVKE